jgi:hypothetical protein
MSSGGMGGFFSALLWRFSCTVYRNWEEVRIWRGFGGPETNRIRFNQTTLMVALGPVGREAIGLIRSLDNFSISDLSTRLGDKIFHRRSISPTASSHSR